MFMLFQMLLLELIVNAAVPPCQNQRELLWHNFADQANTPRMVLPVQDAK
jgi:hypothetical protein